MLRTGLTVVRGVVGPGLRAALLLCGAGCWLLSGFGAEAGALEAETRIVLRPEMVINESGVGDASLLADEQGEVGDPGSGKGLRPTRAYFPGWDKAVYPAHVVIDLGGERRLTRLFVYNESGESRVSVGTGSPAAWTSQDVTLSGYREWREFPLPVTTRYIRLTLEGPALLPEVVLYGTGFEAPASHLVIARRSVPQPPIDQFIGTNAFIDDPPELLARAAGFVREYHNWAWDTEATDRQVRFQPSGAAGGRSWFFDDYYARLKSLGVTVSPAIQQSSPAYFPGPNIDAKPVAAGADPETPGSYKVHAEHLYQYAARYGSSPVPDASIRIAADQPRRTGLGSLHYLENWNEPDKTWRGREGRFAPFELAAMCSADYDGDKGRMGKTAGVRAADPKMRLVMGGLAGVRLQYLRAMKLWAEVHRGGDFPADVINLHHYSSDGPDDQGFKTTGISPEADHLRERFAEVVAWRNVNVPKCELWVTEFGYDTDPRSPLHAPAIGTYSAEEVQGMWLIRSYLALAAAGVDRAAMFMFRDVKSDDGGVFASCGMVTEKGKWAPKASYFYIATLKKRLVGMRFSGEVTTGRKDVLVYRFAGAGGQTAYVAWCPTADDRHAKGVSIAVPGAAATAVELTTGSLDGVASKLQVSGGAVSVDVREKPVIVLAAGS